MDPAALPRLFAGAAGRPVATAQVLLDAGRRPERGLPLAGAAHPVHRADRLLRRGRAGAGPPAAAPAGVARWPGCCSRAAPTRTTGRRSTTGCSPATTATCELLLEYGLGTGTGGVWPAARRGAGTPAEMMRRQVDWAPRTASRTAGPAREHGFGPHGGVRQPRSAAPSTDSAPRRRARHGCQVCREPAQTSTRCKDGRANRPAPPRLDRRCGHGDRALRAAGADPDLLDDMFGTTPLAWAEYARQPETAEILRSVTESTR